MSNPLGSNCETRRNEWSAGLGTLWGTLFGVGCAEQVSLCSTPPPPPVGGVGSYNRHDIGGKVEWRPPWLLTP